MQKKQKWTDMGKKQPEKGVVILGKILSGSKIIKVKVIGDVWDYGISEWKYFETN